MSTQPSKLINHETSKLKRLTYFPSLEFRLVGIAIFLVISFFSPDISAYERSSFSVYAVSENNLNDSIVGFGVTTLHKINNSNVGIAVDSSLSNAEVVDTYGYEQSYLAWEVGAKIGYFSTLFIYAEFGFDFGELAFQDRDEDVYYYEDSNEDVYYYNNFDIDIRPDREDYSNDIDAYLGLGTGVDFGHVQLTAFARYRQIDGEFWKANNQTFTGIKASISF